MKEITSRWKAPLKKMTSPTVTVRPPLLVKLYNSHGVDLLKMAGNDICYSYGSLFHKNPWCIIMHLSFFSEVPTLLDPGTIVY